MNHISRGSLEKDAMLASLPFARFTLDNGLTVVVHEDRKAPIVAVAIWYRVGSGDEPAGRTGFAHLFEHLMFSGSEHHRQPYHDAFSHAGASDLNGTTWFDRTNYFVTVPRAALDLALFMESDRMGHLLGAVGQDELDMQRGIVSNEKSQNESRPYGKLPEVMQRNNYPANHPYAHTTIGSMEDLATSSLDDVKNWFRTHYGAANATLVLSGDIDVAEAREKAEHYFGDIDPGPPPVHPLPWAPRPRDARRGELHDRVPHAMIDRQWNGPAWGEDSYPMLELGAAILGGGPTSRLHRRLVRDEKLANSVYARCQRLAVTSPFNIRAFARDPSYLPQIEAIIEDELAAFLADGPTADELQNYRGAMAASFNRNMEYIGGMSGKAAMLGEGQALLGRPDQRRSDFVAMLEASAAAIVGAMRQWIDDGHYTLLVRPQAEDGVDHPASGIDGWAADVDRQVFGAPSDKRWRTAAKGADRSAGVPAVGAPARNIFPAANDLRLGSGLRILSVQRPASPVVQAILDFPGGWSRDDASLPGLASVTADVMMEGTMSHDALALQERLDRLGAHLSVTAGAGSTRMMLNVPTYSWDAAVDLLEDLIRRPAFEAASVNHVRDRRLTQFTRTFADPGQLAQTIMPSLLFGEAHPYGRPGGGGGTVEALQAILPKDLRAWHQRQFQPRGATLSVCGAIATADVARRFEAIFADGEWGNGLAGEAIMAPADDDAPRIYLIDMPGAGQSVILGGTVTPLLDAGTIIAGRAVNGILGGSFEARLNMNLREDKHWAYGAGSNFAERAGPGMILLSASVQQDRTGAALREMMSEADDIWTRRPPTGAELDRLKVQALGSRASRYETASAVCAKLASDALLGFDTEQAAREDTALERLTVDAVAEMAAKIFGARPMRWLIVGDASKIEKEIGDTVGTIATRIDPRQILGNPG